MSDDARKLILQRRARFVAAAVASVGMGAGCEKESAPPLMCLSQIQPPADSGATENSGADTGAQVTDTGPPPMPCLSVSTATPANDPALPPGDNAVDGGPAPAPCLSPMPCLKIAPPPQKHH